MMVDFLRVLAAFAIAVAGGMLFKRIKLPYVLAWLLAGIALSPFALGLVPATVSTAVWYKLLANFVKFCVGATMGIGSNKSKDNKTGRQFITISAVESLSTFLLVSAVFSVAFSIAGVPLFLAFIFGTIAMVTSLATSVTIIKSYKGSGPLSSMALPVMSMSSLLGIIVFMIVLSISVGTSPEPSSTSGSILVTLAGSLGSGIVLGLLASIALNAFKNQKSDSPVYYLGLLVGGGVTVSLSHWVFSQSGFNYLVAGIFFSIMLARNVEPERMAKITADTQTAQSLIFAFFILTLGVNINYQFVLNAGIFTLLFFVSRTIGKVGAARLGGRLAGAQDSVKKNIGFLLLPHASICLILTAVAAETLGGIFPAETEIMQGTLMAALVINEIVSPILIKRALKNAGELNA